jgi:malonate-semialdehyde dehydrogenase (acetylating)/methylmalonate-semialdehyde dehydrogenase
MQAAADAASEAFKTWKKSSVMHRQRILFELARLIRENQGEIAKLITREQGKTIPDAEGDVLRGLRMQRPLRLSLSPVAVACVWSPSTMRTLPCACRGC